MTRVIVTGAAGRMGSRIIGLLGGLLAPVSQWADLTLAGATERKGHPKIGQDAGEVAGVGRLGVTITDDPGALLRAASGGPAALIAFTTPEATLEHLRQAAERGAAAVIGTTGFTLDQHQEIRTLAKRMPCVLSPNMSLGVTLLLNILPDMAKVLGEAYDIEIVETHHRAKQDAPSGTALAMAQAMAEALGCRLEDVAVYDRHSRIGPRPPGAIGIQSLRAGESVGDHTVLFGGPGEEITVTHRALSRDAFARGALAAARWVAGRPAGLYNMGHVLWVKP